MTCNKKFSNQIKVRYLRLFNQVECAAFYSMNFFILETRENTRWNMIHTIPDAKVAFKTLFHIVAQDKKQQCYKYNELEVGIRIHYYIILYALYTLLAKITDVSGKVPESRNAIRRM